jgi:hypothetical protein
MGEPDFIEIEQTLQSEYDDLDLDNTEFTDYYKNKYQIKLREAHKRLLEGIKNSLLSNGPAYYSSK